MSLPFKKKKIKSFTQSNYLTCFRFPFLTVPEEKKKTSDARPSNWFSLSSPVCRRCNSQKTEYKKPEQQHRQKQKRIPKRALSKKPAGSLHYTDSSACREGTQLSQTQLNSLNGVFQRFNSLHDELKRTSTMVFVKAIQMITFKAHYLQDSVPDLPSCGLLSRMLKRKGVPLRQITAEDLSRLKDFMHFLNQSLHEKLNEAKHLNILSRKQKIMEFERQLVNKGATRGELFFGPQHREIRTRAFQEKERSGKLMLRLREIERDYGRFGDEIEHEASLLHALNHPDYL